MNVKEDRRKELRYKCSGLINLYVFSKSGRSEPVITGLIEDLSESGACIQIDRALPLGTKLLLKSRDGLEVHGVACNVRESSIGCFVGVEFSSPLPIQPLAAERPTAGLRNGQHSRLTARKQVDEGVSSAADNGITRTRSGQQQSGNRDHRPETDAVHSSAVRSYVNLASLLHHIYSLRKRWFGADDEDTSLIPEPAVPLPPQPEDPLRLFDDAPTAAIVLDPDFKILYANTKFIQLVGSVRMLETRSFEQFIAPEDLDRVLECARAALSDSDTSRSIDFQMVGTNGTRFEIASWWRHSPARQRMFVQVIDITEDRRTENDLIALLNGLEVGEEPIGIADWTWNVHSNSVECSRNFAMLHGLDIRTVQQDLTSLIALIHPDDVPRVQEALSGALAGSGIVRLEFRVMRPNGSTALLAACGHVVFDRNGQPVRVVGKTLDITSRANEPDAFGTQAHVTE